MIGWDLLLLAAVSFIQNMAFTWVSRSRNSGDPGYHRWAAFCSNAVWFATFSILTPRLMQAFDTGNWLSVAITGAVYTVATSEGSVLMMRILLNTEKGKRKVGASQ